MRLRLDKKDWKMVSKGCFLCAGIVLVQLIQVSENACGGWTNNAFVIDTFFSGLYINESTSIIEDLSSIPSVIVCQRLCLQNPECVSFFTNKRNRTCRLLGVKYVQEFVDPEQLLDEPGSRYFNLEHPTGLCTDYIWDRVDNKCYWFYIQPELLSDARSACTSRGENLITPKTAAFMNRIRRQLLSMSLINVAGYWFGGSDSANEGTWVWDDGTPIDYNNWKSLYPKNQSAGNDYLLLQRDLGMWRWIDSTTLTPKRYICERTLV